MKKLTHYLAILLSTVIFPSFAQTNVSKTEHSTINTHFEGLSDQDKVKDLHSIHNGTYQLRVSNTNYSPLLTLEILTIVSENRLQSNSQVFEIDEFTTLYLPSVDQIRSESFTALPTVIYLSGPTMSTDDN